MYMNMLFLLKNMYALQPLPLLVSFKAKAVQWKLAFEHLPGTPNIPTFLAIPLHIALKTDTPAAGIYSMFWNWFPLSVTPHFIEVVRRDTLEGIGCQTCCCTLHPEVVRGERVAYYPLWNPWLAVKCSVIKHLPLELHVRGALVSSHCQCFEIRIWA